MSTDKKLGRRKAGSWGRTGSAKLKRQANKATRSASKADMFDLYCESDNADVKAIMREGITS